MLQKLAEMGAYVHVGDPLLEIACIRELDVFLELPERYAERVRVGAPLTLHADALPGWRRDAKVEAIVPAADPKSRNIPIRLRVDNADGRLFPGMFVRSRVVVQRLEDAILVPVEAVTPRDDIKVVFVVEEARVRMAAVQVIFVNDGFAALRDGLKVGDVVVTVGGESLFPGAAVEVASPQQGAEPAP